MDDHSRVRSPSSVFSVFRYAKFLCAVGFVTVAVILVVWLAPHVQFGTKTLIAAANTISRTLYAVNQSSATRGSISVYDIDHGHSLIKTIPTVSDVDDVRGVAVSAATGKLYVAYRT